MQFVKRLLKRYQSLRWPIKVLILLLAAVLFSCAAVGVVMGSIEIAPFMSVLSGVVAFGGCCWLGKLVIDLYQESKLLERDLASFQRSSDSFQRSCDSFQQSCDSFQQSSDSFQQSSDSFQRTRAEFRQARDDLQQALQAAREEQALCNRLEAESQQLRAEGESWQRLMMFLVNYLAEQKRLGNRTNAEWPKNPIDEALRGNLSEDQLREVSCPVTLAVMQDPVLAPDRKHYERWVLQTLFDSGHKTCPCDPSKMLPNPSELPTDSAMKAQIQALLQQVQAAALVVVVVPSPDIVAVPPRSPRAGRFFSPAHGASSAARPGADDPSRQRFGWQEPRH